MGLSILIYCPDRHISYQANTPDIRGVGGGVTTRIRLAHSLAKIGHQVTVIGHVPRRQIFQGVTYFPLGDGNHPQATDVLLLTTSGDKLSLFPALDLNLNARLREIWVHGTTPIQGLEQVEYDFVVTVSNFIRKWVVNEWNVPSNKVFVAYNGVKDYRLKRYLWNPPSQRDPYSLIYFSHPSKGLSTAIEVLRLLRQMDQRFKLHVYGGSALWGGDDQPPESEPGMIYHGMVGQKIIARALQKASVSFHLQTIVEALSLSLIEAMAYGAIPIISPIGGMREVVKDGYDGFWIEGDHNDKDVHKRAAQLIINLVESPGYVNFIRKNAMNVPWSSHNQAEVWTAHWHWELAQKGVKFSESHCPEKECGGEWLITPDGYHCLKCGNYSRKGR
jgi:glycosyltransferase involved in cell wall biosynthesis